MNKSPNFSRAQMLRDAITNPSTPAVKRAVDTLMLKVSAMSPEDKASINGLIAGCCDPRTEEAASQMQVPACVKQAFDDLRTQIPGMMGDVRVTSRALRALMTNQPTRLASRQTVLTAGATGTASAGTATLTVTAPEGQRFIPNFIFIPASNAENWALKAGSYVGSAKYPIVEGIDETYPLPADAFVSPNQENSMLVSLPPIGDGETTGPAATFLWVNTSGATANITMSVFGTLEDDGAC